MKLGWTYLERIAKDYGADVADELVDYHAAQMAGIEQVVKEEGIECDFTQRGSYDVVCDQGVADEYQATYERLLRRELKGMKRVRNVSAECAEEVYRSSGF